MSSDVLAPNIPPSPASGRHSELRPTFFMSRGNGIFTPLIPADELPTDMMIVGVPKVMNFDKTTGMTSVGEIMASGLHYEIKRGKDMDQQCGTKPSLSPQSFQVPNAVVVKHPLFADARGPTTPSSACQGSVVIDNPIASAHPATCLPTCAIENTSQAHTNKSFRWPDQHGMAKGNGHSPISVNSGKDILKPTSKNQSLDISRRSSLGAQAVIDAITSTTKTTGRASFGNRDYQRQGQVLIRGPLKDDSKTYCSYWIRHGECDYTQQGCKFLHEMPQDREALNKIGLRDFPRWWKELNALNVGTWRCHPPGWNSKMPSAGSSQTSSPASGISSNADVTIANAPETVVAVGSASDASEQTREAVATPPARSSTIRQRVPRARDGGSPSSATSGSSPTLFPENSQISPFVRDALHPQARALRIQRLMTPESSPEGGVWIQKNVKEGQKKADSSDEGNAANDDGSSLIELEPVI